MTLAPDDLEIVITISCDLCSSNMKSSENMLLFLIMKESWHIPVLKLALIQEYSETSQALKGARSGISAARGSSVQTAHYCLALSVFSLRPSLNRKHSFNSFVIVKPTGEPVIGWG